ncbi:unnamed protein product [Medioppia subpectinata]|uniref:Uncharacterized protein n=1 Tax=Medioppia subpectinata TaxID=1979941 RepID=A0A7R9KGQ6_9ACAR|nr:unnamed protein product [Medioppia subpectinata]CAG2101881.1 unnamed protein product [Medioppia subpectinata]
MSVVSDRVVSLMFIVSSESVSGVSERLMCMCAEVQDSMPENYCRAFPFASCALMLRQKTTEKTEPIDHKRLHKSYTSTYLPVLREESGE